MDLIQQAAIDLRADVDTHQSVSRAAETLRDASRAGTDLEPAFEALADALHRAVEYGVLPAVAEALARQLLRTAQGERLSELFETCDGSAQLSTALRNLARQGADLSPLLPALLRPVARLNVAEVLGAWVHEAPGRLDSILPLLAVENPEGLLRLLEVVWWDQRTRQVSLRVLAPYLTAPESATRRRTVALVQRAAGAADLSELGGPLHGLLDDEDRWVRVWASYALAKLALDEGDESLLEELRSNPHEDVRLETLRAAATTFQSNQSAIALEQLLHGALDPAASVRSDALDRLRKGQASVGRLSISELWQERLAAASTADAAELLAMVAEDDDACAICLTLPRRGGWTSQSDVPDAYEALVDLGDGLAACPTCGNFYLRAYEEESEDGAFYQTWSVTRLSPSDSRGLPGQYGAQARAAYGDKIALHHRRLTDPRERLREDAGWALAQHYLAVDDWAALHALVHAEPIAAARVAAETIEGLAPDGGLPMTFLVGPRAALPPIVRMRVRCGLRDNADLVHEVLREADPPPLAAGLSEVDRAHRDGVDVAPFLDRILELIGHPDEDVRRPAMWIASRQDDPGVVGLVAARARALLEDPAPGVRAAACRLLSDFASSPPAVHALPRLCELLDDPAVRWDANRAIRAVGRAGADLQSLSARLVERMARTGRGSTLDDLELLELVRVQGWDVRGAVTTVLAVVEEGAGQTRAVACDILGRLIDADVLDGPQLDAVQKMLPRLVGYQTEALSRCVAAARLRADDRPNLRALLAASTTVIWGTIDVLREAAARGRNLLDLLDAVEVVTAVHPGVVADHARKLLSEIAHRASVDAPSIDLEELQRLVADFRAEVRAYDAFDSEFSPNPYSPDTAVSAVVALGPGVVPSLCEIARGSDREAAYWAIVGLMRVGPGAGEEALRTLGPLVTVQYVGALAARAIAAIDEARFFELGLHLDPTAVGDVAKRRQREGTAAAWLQRVFALGQEAASLAAVAGLVDVDPADTALQVVLRGALSSPFPSVRGKAVWLLGRLPGAAPVESLLNAMITSGYVAPVEAVAFHPDSIGLVSVLAKQGNVGILAQLLRRRRCAGLETPPELVRAVIEEELRNPKREWRYEEHDVHDAAQCALELGDDSLLPALVDAVVPENGGYAWRSLFEALAYFGERAVVALEHRRESADAGRAERITWMLDELATRGSLDLTWADDLFVQGSIDHTTNCAFETYGTVLRAGPSAHAAFQLAWIDRAFGAAIAVERARWIGSLGCTDEALLAELTTPVPPLIGSRSGWRSCDATGVGAALAAGLAGLAFAGSREPAHQQIARAHVERVRRGCVT